MLRQPLAFLGGAENLLQAKLGALAGDVNCQTRLMLAEAGARADLVRLRLSLGFDIIVVDTHLGGPGAVTGYAVQLDPVG
ncbi:hypothetical protein D3C75_1118630 [compost metagenome]